MRPNQGRGDIKTLMSRSKSRPQTSVFGSAFGLLAAILGGRENPTAEPNKQTLKILLEPTHINIQIKMH